MSRFRPGRGRRIDLGKLLGFGPRDLAPIRLSTPDDFTGDEVLEALRAGGAGIPRPRRAAARRRKRERLARQGRRPQTVSESSRHRRRAHRLEVEARAQTARLRGEAGKVIEA